MITEPARRTSHPSHRLGHHIFFFFFWKKDPILEKKKRIKAIK
ncbi:unnamed protein product [Arabidopsis halleri]